MFTRRKTKSLRSARVVVLLQDPQPEEHAGLVDGLLRLQDLHDLEQPQTLVHRRHQGHDDATPIRQQQHQSELPAVEWWWWWWWWHRSHQQSNRRGYQVQKSESSGPQEGDQRNWTRRVTTKHFREYCFIWIRKLTCRRVIYGNDFFLFDRSIPARRAAAVVVSRARVRS